MMDAAAFLALRRPPPPQALEAWLRAGVRDGDTALGLSEQALAELAAARSAPGKVRRSAWRLLAADALLTYACEAALEGADPPAVFEEILGKAAGGA